MTDDAADAPIRLEWRKASELAANPSNWRKPGE